MNISIIDDDKILTSRMKKRLEKEWFFVKIFSWLNDFITNHKLKADMYLIDIWLGDWSWFDLIKFIRKEKKSNTPIIIVSAYSDKEKKIYWLNLWADDYMPKIFSTEELIARINAVIRRKNNIKDLKLKYKNIKFDLNSKSIMIWNKNIYLTKKETQLAYFFISNKWKMLSKFDLIEYVWWEYEADLVTDNTINSTLSKVRKKLWKNFNLITKINEWYILKN